VKREGRGRAKGSNSVECLRQPMNAALMSEEARARPLKKLILNCNFRYCLCHFDSFAALIVR